MKGFTRNKKFIPMTDYKKVTRKSRDQKAKTQGVRMKRLTQLQVDEIKKNVLPLDKHAIMMMEFHQGQARRDRIANPKWNSMTQAERLKALERSGVHETAMGQKLPSRETLSKLPYHELPHYAKTDLGFHFFNLDREGRVRKKRDAFNDPELAEIKNKKAFIEPLVRAVLQKDEDGRNIIKAKNFSRDFEAPFLYFGVTDSGNVKLGEITQHPFKGQPEEVRNLIGKPVISRGNNTLKISIDSSNFFLTIAQNNLEQELAKNKAKGNVK